MYRCYRLISGGSEGGFLKLIKMQNNLLYVSLLVNRSLNQCRELYALCGTFERYLQFEATVSEYRGKSFVPADKETLDEYLSSHPLPKK